MPSLNRRITRTLRTTTAQITTPIISAIAAELSPTYTYETGPYPGLIGEPPPPGPKHFPFPNTPTDNDVLFEFHMFGYTTIAAALQFLQLYRTVWWLPYSYTNQSMNFYLIDINLVTFILIILSRRLIYKFGCKILDLWVPPQYLDFSTLCYRVFLFATIVLSLSWCSYFIIQNHPMVNIFYLCYPISVYLILFGFTIVPFFELTYWNANLGPPLHACSVNAREIRTEVENLKVNFNGRMKQIIFSSVLSAYYAGFVPCCFAQSFVYYDINWSTQHVIFLWLGSFASYAIHVLPLRYCDTLHRSALHLGYWDKVETRSQLPVTQVWHEDTLWPFGAMVKHGRDIYRGLGDANAAEPGNSVYARFFTMFYNPSIVLAGLLVIHVALVLFQLTLLLRSFASWHNIISIVLLLCFNYYTLFKIGRDYLISQKIYKAEQAMHGKVSEH